MMWLPNSGAERVVLTVATLALAIAVVALYTAINPLGRGFQSEFDHRARAWLVANPEVVLEAVQTLQRREKEAEASELHHQVRTRAPELFNDPRDPIAGNPDGDVTLVVFFDYNCPYCRKAAPHLPRLSKSDPNLKIVFKEFPILGPGSQFAARAALAADRQGSYEVYHHAMMSYTGALNQTSTLKIAETVGLDIARLKKDMEDPAIQGTIDGNLELARSLRINGTPSWVIGDEVVRGLVDLDALTRLIKRARAERK